MRGLEGENQNEMCAEKRLDSAIFCCILACTKIDPDFQHSETRTVSRVTPAFLCIIPNRSHVSPQKVGTKAGTKSKGTLKRCY